MSEETSQAAVSRRRDFVRFPAHSLRAALVVASEQRLRTGSGTADRLTKHRRFVWAWPATRFVTSLARR